MCNIYKSDTAWKRFGLSPTILELQEDSDAKYMWKVALNWKASYRIEKIDWPSTSPNLSPIENFWQLLKMKLGEKTLADCHVSL